jgi:septal ring factor EnvC (AmiA/AmiB activator)
LQKNKHVLTHRATEMRASLEPKEQQIESLKEQILQLEKVFEQQMKSISESKKDLDKKQFKITQLSKELNAQKNITKEKEKTIFKIITDIHNYVQSKDEKSYAAGLMKLNQDYVRPRASELLEKKKKDPETIEELDRQLRYMERSITQLKLNTMKNENRTRLHIKKKTTENTKLIKELNDLKVDKKDLIAANKKLREDVRNLEEKIKRIKGKEDEYDMPGSAQSMTAKMGQDEGIPSLVGGRPHSVKKQSKGKLYKGTPYQYRMTNLEDKAKIAELTAQLEDTQQMVMIQKLEIRSLKERFIALVNDRNRIIAQNDGAGSQNDGDNGHNMMTPGDDEGFLPRVDHKN